MHLRGTAVCALLATFLLAPEPVRAQSDVEHWSATLTRENKAGGEDSAYGFGPDLTDAVGGTSGSVVPSTFTYADVSYTVGQLWVATSRGASIFATTPALPSDAGLTLRFPTFRTTATANCLVGGTVDLALDSTSFDAIPNFHGDVRYRWDADDVTCLDKNDWAADLSTTGTVKLVGPQPPPTIIGVTVTSTPSQTSSGALEPDTYGDGETIAFTVTFSEAVAVSGIVHYTFSLGGATARRVDAPYESGGGLDRAGLRLYRGVDRHGPRRHRAARKPPIRRRRQRTGGTRVGRIDHRSWERR